MAIDGIEEGKEYLCQEQTTGNANTGLFRIDTDAISARFVSYDKEPGFQASNSLILRTEENRIVSLHDNIIGEPGRHYSKAAVAYSQRVVSNNAIVGWSPWLISDLVKKIDFRIDGADDVLLHSDKHRELVKTDAIHQDNTLFSLELPGAELKVWYGYTLGTYDHHATNVRPGFALEFQNAVPLDEARKYVQRIVKFFGAVTGHFLWPSDFSISRFSNAEQSAAIAAKKPLYPHRYFEITTKSGPPDEQPWVGSQFAHVRTNADLSALEACLKDWVERDQTWEAASNLMMSSFRLDHRQFDPARLLAATKWLEKIPETASQPVMSPDAVIELAAEVGKLAVERGLGDISGRFAGAVKTISKETRTQQHQRLVNDVKIKLGPHIFDDQIVQYLDAANGFRGIAAHSQMSMESHSEFSRFCKATYALECLCYLLTIKDLPMSNNGKTRLMRHPILRNYETSWVVDDAGHRI